MAQVSPDGRWWWDGAAWRPMPAAPPPRRSSAAVWWIVGGSCLGVLLLVALVSGAVLFFTWQSIQAERPVGGGSAAVPAGFPSEFPSYPGATVVGGSVSGGSPRTFHVTYRSADGTASVCSFYRSALSSGDYRLVARVSVPLIGTNCVYGFTNPVAGFSGSVSSTSDVAAGGTRIVLTLNSR